MEKLNNFINNNIRYIVLVIGAIALLYMKSIFVTWAEYNELKSDVDFLKTEILLIKSKYENKVISMEKDHETMDERLGKKITIINQNTKEIDDNENKLIELETIIKK